MSARQCPICHCVNDSMTEVAGDLHCLACGYVADVPMEAWDECEAQKDARITDLSGGLHAMKLISRSDKARIAELEADLDHQITWREEAMSALRGRAELAEAERDDYKAVAIDAAKDQARLTAELADIRAWRCETCADRDSHSVDEPCDRFSDSFLAFMRDHCKGKPVSCCFWVERETA